MTDEVGELMTIEEVSARLRVPASTIRSWIQREQNLTVVRLGPRSPRFVREDVDRFLRERAAAPRVVYGAKTTRHEGAKV